MTDHELPASLTHEIESINERETAFETVLFKDGVMARMTGLVLAEFIGEKHSGHIHYDSLRRDVEEFDRNDEWNAHFSGLVPADWRYSSFAVESALRTAGVHNLTLSPTLAHAVAMHPEEGLLASLAYWQPLRTGHAAQVFRALKDGPLPDYWNQSKLDEQTFLERQRLNGTPDELLARARELADNPEIPALKMDDYRHFDPREEPEYVRRGLARELGVDQALADRLGSTGVWLLETGRSTGQNHSSDIESLTARLAKYDKRDTQLPVALFKRGPGALASLLAATIVQSPHRDLAYELAHRPLRRDFPFPELRDAGELFLKAVNTTHISARHGIDSVSRVAAANRESSRKQPDVIRELCKSDYFDGELLHFLYQRPTVAHNQVRSIYDRTEDVARTALDIEKDLRTYNVF